ncbi:hypothetical protein CIW52_31665 [Mycolicibacterium sp. P9-64]|uniref:hypothetical protein n=1 Tax=Mycolicibacterium sp. P9-64 TaxID=2024612 RepID=UPI0011EE1FC3|nr:hypothetical protein [Mycolicibacterium sp. P9-64]KAA0077262.1 hypothetical protein CIW52_31665 [Mycolicibacterium sp. P9-64]
MPKSNELAELHHLIGQLTRCVTSLQATYGNAPAMRRVINDAERILNGIDRLDIDVEELEVACGLALAKRHGPMIQIPDTDYDHGFWSDVDHEGVGGRCAS